MTTQNMTTTRGGKPGDVARKAQFLNMQQDGIKIRSVRFKNKKAYNRKDRSWMKD